MGTTGVEIPRGASGDLARNFKFEETGKPEEDNVAAYQAYYELYKAERFADAVVGNKESVLHNVGLAQMREAFITLHKKFGKGEKLDFSGGQRELVN
jgi:hypothetical protein